MITYGYDLILPTYKTQILLANINHWIIEAWRRFPIYDVALYSAVNEFSAIEQGLYNSAPSITPV